MIRDDTMSPRQRVAVGGVVCLHKGSRGVLSWTSALVGAGRVRWGVHLALGSVTPGRRGTDSSGDLTVMHACRTAPYPVRVPAVRLGGPAHGHGHSRHHPKLRSGCPAPLLAYPVNALTPRARRRVEMGAKADKDLYFGGV